MTQSLKLIVGLGNPGPEYHQTRHNAGFDYADSLASKYGVQFKSEKKLGADQAKITLAGQECWLIKPMSFMNRSGQAVQILSQFYKILPEQILVAHDDLDLLPGTAKLKSGGGHGGHNGLRDIISRLANQRDFKRLRIGIGHPGESSQVVNFVLARPPASEKHLINQAIEEAVSHTDLMSEHWHKAMTHMNQFKAQS